VTLFLVKLIDFAVKPLGIALIAMITGLVLSKRHWPAGAGIGVFGIFFLWICATPWMGDTLIRSLEERFPPQPVDSVETADAIVALGGGVGRATPPRRHPDLSGGADRVWHAARLYKARVAPTLLVTGGAPPGVSGTAAPAMQEVLESFGVPPDSVLLESKSNTTHGNALYTARICAERGIDRIVLVTSAAHMRRALAAFRTTAPALDIRPAATDHQAVRDPFTLLSLVPSADELQLSTTAFHEYVGYLYYQLRGWIAEPSRESA
jgi:uncharacterized SAM-binding protein YcdF (DUF218 family)